MGELLAQVIPLALGAAVSPLLFFGAIAVMTGPRPLRRGGAYAFGAALPLLAVTALALALGSALSLPEASDAVKGWSDIAFGVLLIALGVRAARRHPEPRPKSPDANAPGGSLTRTVATGAGLMASNVTSFALYLPAMKLIGESTIDAAEKAVAVAVTIAIALGLVLVPLAIVAVAPRASGRVLAAAGAWLQAHRRRLALIICFGLGAYLVVHGLARVG